ncbi:MAG: MBOAT family protein [Elusimicrobia bacterium]|nr:MBOAT family protein [Candidatus Liberimonas magnetica]
MLLVASCIFYMAFIPVYILILFLLILIDYFAGMWIEDNLGEKKKLFLIISIISTCAVLFVFKYFNFFNGNFALIAKFFGWNYPIGVLNIILPIGLSFHTFQSLSYVVEVYRGRQKAQRHFTTYALYVMFFPMLVAGPIERAGHLMPQLTAPRIITRELVYKGFYLMLWGLFQKVVIADNLAMVVNDVFARQAPYDGIAVLIALYAFAFQIFCDFAGYSNIAIGLGNCMGFDIMTNFNMPYFSTNPSEFWKRWHISLSSWLRDYLYIPLGGNRGTKWQTYKNLLITMFLGGLWHGAAWTYIIWGVFHGAILALNKYFKELNYKFFSPRGAFSERLWFVIRIIFFFQVTCLGWLFFRATSIEQIWQMIYSILFNFNLNQIEFGMFSKMFVFSSVIIIIQYFQYKKDDLNFILKENWMLRTAFYCTLYLLIIFFGVTDGSNFIYFQF